MTAVVDLAEAPSVVDQHNRDGQEVEGDGAEHANQVGKVCLFEVVLPDDHVVAKSQPITQAEKDKDCRERVYFSLEKVLVSLGLRVAPQKLILLPQLLYQDNHSCHQPNKEEKKEDAEALDEALFEDHPIFLARGAWAGQENYYNRAQQVPKAEKCDCFAAK